MVSAAILDSSYQAFFDIVYVIIQRRNVPANLVKNHQEGLAGISFQIQDGGSRRVGFW